MAAEAEGDGRLRATISSRSQCWSSRIERGYDCSGIRTASSVIQSNGSREWWRTDSRPWNLWKERKGRQPAP